MLSTRSVVYTGSGVYVALIDGGLDEETPGVLEALGAGLDEALQSGIVRFVVEDLSPGFERSEVMAGAAPRDHTQQGSPSSSPLDAPSPSESELHSVTVHI